MTLYRSLGTTDASSALRRLTSAQGLGAEVIRDLLNAQEGDTDAAISRALARLGRFCGSDRCSIFTKTGADRIRNTHEWCAPGIDPMIAARQDSPRNTGPDWWNLFDEETHSLVRDIRDLESTDPVRRTLATRGIRSLLVVPLAHAGRVSGFIGFEANEPARDFLDGEVDLIKSVSGVIAALLTRRAIEAEVAQVRAAQDLERERMKATLSVLPDLLLELDHDLRVTGVHANSRMELAVAPEALLNQYIVDLLPPRGKVLAATIRRDLARSDISVGHRLNLKLGSRTQWLALSAARRPCEFEGALPGYVVIARDITEAHLGRIEVERLGQIARNTTNLIVITTLDGRIDWVNPAFETRTGYRLDEARGQTPGALLQCPQTDPATVAAVAAALKDQRPITCEILNRTRAGEHYWVELSIQPMRDSSGKVTGFMSVQTDMTQHHLTAQSLERALAAEKSAREQLRSAVGIMQDAFIQFDADQRLVLCNRRYRDLHPELDELLVPGTPLATILRHGLDRGCYDPETMTAEAWLDTELRGFHLRFTQSSVVRHHGHWYRLTKQPTPDGGRMIMLSDITDLKHAEERALSDRERAMDASRDGIAMMSLDGAVLYANAAAASIFGRANAAAVVGLH